ncbi:MAG: hypothetical protein SNJ71_00325 [Bacteroidales bacterium]
MKKLYLFKNPKKFHYVPFTALRSAIITPSLNLIELKNPLTQTINLYFLDPEQFDFEKYKTIITDGQFTYIIRKIPFRLLDSFYSIERINSYVNNEQIITEFEYPINGTKPDFSYWIKSSTPPVVTNYTYSKL